MRLSLPLYARILLWFFLNVLLLAAGFFLFFRVQFRFGFDSLLAGQAGDRLQAIGELMAPELSEAEPADWDAIVQRFSRAYRVQFLLFRPDGSQVAGEPVDLPPEVRVRLIERLGPGFGSGRGPPPGRGPWRDPDRLGPPAEESFMVRTSRPSRYWVGLRLPVDNPIVRRPRPLILVAQSESLWGGGLFFEVTPWLLAGVVAVLFSVLFWLPLVFGVTRAVSLMTRATEQIANGRFDARVRVIRRDELGRLAQAINRMAERLAGFVAGQKRFLGDSAHELCSPLARMQVALGILEQQQAGARERGYVEDVREEVQHMSSLVNELLSFSKASLRPADIPLQPVAVAPLVEQVLAREAAEPGRVAVDVAPDLCVLAEPELLTRALANLVRNALRYAGGSGVIRLTGRARGDRVELSISDEGPGVPAEALQQIFDPFYRVETSRSRTTGGIGLGLAIVKTCVEACQGTVTARNREPAGLEVAIELDACPA